MKEQKNSVTQKMQRLCDRELVKKIEEFNSEVRDIQDKNARFSEYRKLLSEICGFLNSIKTAIGEFSSSKPNQNLSQEEIMVKCEEPKKQYEEWMLKGKELVDQLALDICKNEKEFFESIKNLNKVPAKGKLLQKSEALLGDESEALSGDLKADAITEYLSRVQEKLNNFENLVSGFSKVKKGPWFLPEDAILNELRELIKLLYLKGDENVDLKHRLFVNRGIRGSLFNSESSDTKDYITKEFQPEVMAKISHLFCNTNITGLWEEEKEREGIHSGRLEKRVLDDSLCGVRLTAREQVRYQEQERQKYKSEDLTPGNNY